VDVLSAIHDQVLDFVLLNDDTIDLSQAGPILENLANAITEVTVVGEIEHEHTTEGNTEGKGSTSLDVNTEKIGVSTSISSGESQRRIARRLVTGIEKHRIHFPSIQVYFNKIIELLGGKELWVILDEWAEVPLELQPFLGDLLRRSLFPLFGTTVKIGAIDHRSNFRVAKSSSEYIGIEVGADVTSINLDEYMVFDNNEELALEFFENLLFKHVNPHLPPQIKFSQVKFLIPNTFTQVGAFSEFVRSTEGVPRDAINILVNAALKARKDKISMIHIRDSARIWYTRDKEKSVASKENALPLLRWIIDEVISHRIARAFLIPTDTSNELIDFLFDSRVLHLIKQSVAGQDKPGIRYNVFSIDYGCYVDLINTKRAPQGLFQAETENGVEFIQVPVNDYRAIRRAILDLDEFYEKSA
ncbi:MAG: hypothetical protein KDC84_15675, partial [Crocinitomicaceae bacterium]|nr:hypothetical protein [Crocinitomicaceae bacterium]